MTRTMNEKYGDGSDETHVMCEKCACCKTCGCACERQQLREEQEKKDNEKK